MKETYCEWLCRDIDNTRIRESSVTLKSEGVVPGDVVAWRNADRSRVRRRLRSTFGDRKCEGVCATDTQRGAEEARKEREGQHPL